MSSLTIELVSLLGEDRVLKEPEDLIPYSFDGTAALRQRPHCVVFPKTAIEISAILRIAKAQKTPVVTRGSGTGLSGGSLPVKDCIVLCIVKLNQVLKLDEKNLSLLVETGVITQKIAEIAEMAGLFFHQTPALSKYPRLEEISLKSPADYVD